MVKEQYIMGSMKKVKTIPHFFMDDFIKNDRKEGFIDAAGVGEIQ